MTATRPKARRAAQAALLSGLLLGVAVPAPASAETLLGTITIDATQDTGETSAVTLQKGTAYRLEVSGTMTVSGPQRLDALYCYGSRIGFTDCQPPQHEPVSPAGRGLLVGTRSTTLSTRIDSFMSPDACCVGEAPFQGGHSYSVPYHPDLSGKLRALTRGGTANCSTSVCPETTTGEFTIKIFGPDPPPCSAAQSCPAPRGERATVGRISGEVVFRIKAGEWRPLNQGDKLPPDAEIFTGVDSSVTLTLSDGSSFELNELTQILLDTLERTGEERIRVRIQLDVGKIKARVRKDFMLDCGDPSDPESDCWKIVTPTATAGVRGTVFSVFYDAVARAAIVTTREGTVSVDPAAAGLATTIVPAGKELEVTAKAMSKLTKPGQAGARGGVNREKARALVLARLDRAARGCKLTTPRSKSVFGIKPAPKGWLVSVKVSGKAKGKSTWTVKGGKASPKNKLAKKIARGCR